jgi:hypothetical protein
VRTFVHAWCAQHLKEASRSLNFVAIASVLRAEAAESTSSRLYYLLRVLHKIAMSPFAVELCHASVKSQLAPALEQVRLCGRKCCALAG